MTLFRLSLALFSPWAPAEWRIDVDIGREEAWNQEPGWASSGGRLQFPTFVNVESDYANNDENQEEINFMGPKSLRLAVLEDPVFVSKEGEQVIGIEEEAAWKLQLPKSPSQPGTLRFWMDLLGDEDTPGVAATRNDVTLPSGRLFFMAKCWRESALAQGQALRRIDKEAAEEIQQRIDTQLSHETGDRRLDGTNPVETIQASLEMSALITERNNRAEAVRSGPPQEAILGHWPGNTERLAIAVGTVAIKYSRLWREEFRVVGKFRAVPVLATQSMEVTAP